MAAKPVVFDDENPEWTEQDFARARPGAEVLPAEFVAGFKRKPGRPVGTTTSDRQQVTLRLPREVIDFFKADGPGWQTRAVEVLSREAKSAAGGSYRTAKSGSSAVKSGGAAKRKPRGERKQA